MGNRVSSHRLRTERVVLLLAVTILAVTLGLGTRSSKAHAPVIGTGWLNPANGVVIRNIATQPSDKAPLTIAKQPGDSEAMIAVTGVLKSNPLNFVELQPPELPPVPFLYHERGSSLGQFLPIPTDVYDGRPSQLLRDDPLARKIIYQDDFSAPNGNWPSGEDDICSVGFSKGQYVITLKKRATCLAAERHVVGDMAVQTDMHDPDPSGNRLVEYGLAFGVQSVSDTHYRFWVSPSNRTFRLVHRHGNEVTEVVEQQQSDHILSGVAVNSLRVERRSREVRLYANGTLLGTYETPDVIDGMTGLIASSSSATGGSVYFDNYLLETVDRYDVASATPAPTSTAGPTPTPRPTRTQPSGGAEVYFDSFEDPLSGWPVVDDDNVIAEYLAGEYHIQFKHVPQRQNIFLSLSMSDNFALDLDMRLPPGSHDAVGLALGVPPNSTRGLRFAVVPTEQIWYLLERPGDSYQYLQLPLRSPAIRAEGSLHLRAEIRGQELRVYVEGVLLGVIPKVSGSGQLGFFLFSGTPENAVSIHEAFFDNFRITVVEPYSIASPSPLPTRTATPRGWMTATPLPSPTYGQTTLLRDDFSDSRSGWPRIRGNLIRDYENGEYRISDKRLSSPSTVPHGPLVSQFSAEISAHGWGQESAHGWAHEYGLVWGSLRFTVLPRSGRFAVKLGETDVVPLTASSAIYVGERTNRLRLERSGIAARVFSNGVLLASIEVPDYPAAQVAPYVLNRSDQDGIDVRFDDFVLESLAHLPSPTPTPTATVQPRPFWFPAHRETFSGSSWPIRRDGLVVVGAWDDAFHMLLSEHTAFYLQSMDACPNASGVAAQVEAQLHDPTQDGLFGVAFDADFRDHFSAILVRPRKGTYALARYDGAKGLSYLRGWTESTAIHTGDAVNRLRVERWGSRLELYANGVSLGGTTGLSVDIGQVGLIAGTAEDAMPFQADFDNFHADCPNGLVELPTRIPTADNIVLRRAWLPLLAASGTGTRSTSTEVPGKIFVGFGVDLAADGELLQPGTVFQEGLSTLAASIEYSGLTLPAQLVWEWWVDGHPMTGRGLRDTSIISDRDGRLGLLIGSGSNAPLPQGTYELRVRLAGEGADRVRGTVRIQQQAPPGATGRPVRTALPVVPTPTFRPAATVTPSPTQPTEPSCKELVLNGDFERGPVSWGYSSILTDAAKAGVSAVIRRAADLSPPQTAPSGDWLIHVHKSGKVNSGHWVYQQVPQHLLFEPGELISANLSFKVAISSTAPRDDVDNHSITLAMVNAAQLDQGRFMQDTWVSANMLRPGVWYEVGPMDIGSFLVREPGWEAAFLSLIVGAAPGFIPTNSTTDFMFDDVTIRACSANPLFNRGAASNWAANHLPLFGAWPWSLPRPQASNSPRPWIRPLGPPLANPILPPIQDSADLSSQVRLLKLVR